MVVSDIRPVLVIACSLVIAGAIVLMPAWRMFSGDRSAADAELPASAGTVKNGTAENEPDDFLDTAPASSAPILSAPRAPAADGEKPGGRKQVTEREQALAATLQSFVEQHPTIGLDGHLPDCDARWKVYTRAIRQGRLPSVADVMAIEDLMSVLRYRYRKHLKEYNARMKALKIDVQLESSLEGPEWTTFLSRLHESAGRSK